VTSKNEILLNGDEIKEIEEYAKQNPQLKDPNRVNLFGFGHKTIWKISPKHELIIVKGNEYTGFEHIHKRHELWSNTPYWIDIIDKSGKKRKKLQNQSKFRADSLPFWDYPSIADSIYSIDNLDNESNKRPKEFDLFIGQHRHKDGSIEKYKLLTYKRTKIVHTLYPQSNKNNGKRVKKFDFVRGPVLVNWNILKSIVEITIPYKNSCNKIKYSIFIRKFLTKHIEECLIYIYNDSGEPERFARLGQRPFESFESITHEEIRWQYADLRGFEQHIKSIDEKLKKE